MRDLSRRGRHQRHGGHPASYRDAFVSIKDDHGFGAVLSETDIWDAVAFYAEGQFDLGFVLRADGTFNGDPVNGQFLFENGSGVGDIACSTCHGLDGLTMPAPAAPGFLSNDNPQEALHKIRFGHPGSPMAGIWDFSADDQSDANDIAAYVQTLQCAPGAYWPNCP